MAHPDHNPDSAIACERTREIIEAYHVLSNPLTRRTYDLWAIQPYQEPLHVVTRPTRDFTCPQWMVKFCLVLVFFGILTAMAYGVHSYLASRTIVFRPELGAINISVAPASPTLFGNRVEALNANVAREDRFRLASNITSWVCLQTAVYAETHSGIHLFADAIPLASF